MSSWSTQPRPNQRRAGAERALAFVSTTERRGSSLPAATERGASAGIRSAAPMVHPNRSTRQWGTVSVTPSNARPEVVQQRRLETSRVGAGASVAGLQRSRGAHPAGGASMPARTDAPRPLRVPVRTTAASVVALTDAGSANAHSKDRNSVAQGTQRQRTAHVTDGATALAPTPRTRARSTPNPTPQRQRVRTGERPTNLRVARPSRNVVRRAPSKWLTGLFVLSLVVCGAMAAIVLHATLAKNQLALDSLRGDVRVAERANQTLRVEVANLESPSRIIFEANRMGLTAATSVQFGEQKSVSK